MYCRLFSQESLPPRKMTESVFSANAKKTTTYAYIQVTKVGVVELFGVVELINKASDFDMATVCFPCPTNSPCWFLLTMTII